MAVRTVTLSPQALDFGVKDGESVLDAALREGVSLRYGCRHGRCSSCKYLVEQGDVDFGAASPYSLSERERDEGYALLCCAKPLTNIVVWDDGEVDTRLQSLLPISEIEATVCSVQQLSSELWELRVEMADPLTFYAGQFIEISVPDHTDVWRSYSIASAPQDGTNLSFVIERIEQGIFSGQLGSIKLGSTLRLRGPYGTSYLRNGDLPVLLVATGSAIAPILSILSDAAHRNDTRHFTFLYGARTQADLVMVDRLNAIARQINLDVKFSLSQPAPECESDGPGPVRPFLRALQRHLLETDELDAYLCGNPDLCDSLGLLLEARGTPSSSIFFDKFVPAT